jgi:hypothetical protein
MNSAASLPFLLRYEEDLHDDGIGRDDEFVYQPDVAGIDVRFPFVPWDWCFLWQRAAS